MKIKILILFSFILSLSCTEKLPSGIKEFKESSGVFIINEGNLSYSNSSLSFYNPETGVITNDIFYDSNGFPVGDALQSMIIMDSIGFLCVSNSGKVLVFNTNTFKHIATIGGLGSPRYMHIINSEKAYITDLYYPFITIINPSEFTITGKIVLGNSSEMLIRKENFVFVNSWSYNNQVYIINSANDELVDSISVRKQPNSMALDRNGYLWVLSDGGYEGSPYGQVKAALTKINSSDFRIEKIYEFNDINNSPSDLCMNSTADSLLYLGGGWAPSSNQKRGIFKMSILQEDLPEIAFITEDDQTFYGLGIDPNNSDIYCSDALNYLQNGKIYRFTSSGQPVDTLSSGIVPGAFYFK